MHLWNEYEGRIVAEKFPLIKLLEPEGRSAFFSTTNGSGSAAVLRLIEAHFDEPEILSRWDAVSKLDQQNLIRIKSFGQAQLDGTALVYAVMEPSDASLAGILRDRALSTEETLQIATSLVSALKALHARNLIHEHIEPANVLAVGEVVKLRSDCIREVPPDSDANEFKARDVRSLALLLLQSLTLQRALTPGTNLPAPFQQIVTNGISGAWGLDEIANALGTPSTPSAAPTPKPQPAAASKPEPAPSTPPISTPEPLQQHRTIVPTTSADSRRITPWTTIAAALILLLFIGWHFLHKSAPPIPTLATMPTSQPTQAASPEPVSAAASTPAAAAAAPAASGARTQWRVVAYTYNHQDQAQNKVTQIAGKHSGLNPEVFAPKGHAPYLVTIGGPLNHDQAAALRRRARAEGLPRDTYIQNFPADAR
jgi:hypothetical protein